MWTKRANCGVMRHPSLDLNFYKDSFMHAKAAALLEAHRQHLLARVSTENLPATLEREVNAFLD